MRTTGSSGRIVPPPQRWVGSLRHVRAAPAPPLDLPVASGDVAADARALRRREGRRVKERPVDLGSGSPFRLLSPAPIAEEGGRLRAAVAVAGSM